MNALKLTSTVCNALDILELLAETHSLGVTDIARRLVLDKGKVFRLLQTLKEKGYVQKNTECKYSLSLRFFEIGNSVVANMGLKQVAYPFMRELASLTGEGINLAIRDGNTMVYIDKIESTATIKVDLRLGLRMPLYCTGLGKALLSGMEDKEIFEMFADEPLTPYTPNTIRSANQLMAAIAEVKKQGYSIDNEEYVDGLLCVAAPVTGYRGKVVAAISVAVPRFLYDEDEGKLEMLIRNVTQVAHNFSRCLSGFQPGAKPSQASGRRS